MEGPSRRTEQDGHEDETDPRDKRRLPRLPLQSGWFRAWSTPESFCSMEQVSFVRAQSHHPKQCGPPVSKPGTWSECPTLEGTTVMALTTFTWGPLGTSTGKALPGPVPVAVLPHAPRDPVW